MLLVLALVHTARGGATKRTCTGKSECCVNGVSTPALSCTLKKKDTCTVLLGDCVGSVCKKMTTNSPTKLLSGCSCKKVSACARRRSPQPRRGTASQHQRSLSPLTTADTALSVVL